MPQGKAPLTCPELARRLLAAEVGQHGLAGDRHLADADEELRGRRQIDVDARAEADQAEALAGAERRRPS